MWNNVIIKKYWTTIKWGKKRVFRTWWPTGFVRGHIVNNVNHRLAVLIWNLGYETWILRAINVINSWVLCIRKIQDRARKEHNWTNYFTGILFSQTHTHPHTIHTRTDTHVHRSVTLAHRHTHTSSLTHVYRFYPLKVDSWQHEVT